MVLLMVCVGEGLYFYETFEYRPGIKFMKT